MRRIHMKERNRWLDWAVELQSLAQAGLTYGHDVYDRERYERIREIAAEMVACGADMPIEKVRGLFCDEVGYQTPKLDTRAAIFDGERILLVRENSGRWSLPGGWVDVNLSVGENAVKEVREEAGRIVTAKRILAVQDRAKHNEPACAWNICKVFIECALVGGEFRENIETTASGWFGEDELPELDVDKNTEEQIQMCFRAHRSERWVTEFD